jgi:hypothetical protein
LAKASHYNLSMKRLFLPILVAALWANAALAQYQTPAVDGTVSPGEYASSLGNYSMTWDAVYLYLGVQVAAPSNAVSLYLDVDPLATPGGGTNANGNLIGYPDSGLAAELPFRADARILATSSGGEIRTRNGAGGWTGASTTDVLTVNGTAREIRIAWTALTGSAAPPTSFLWLAHQISGSTLLDPMPAAGQHAFFSVASTADGASTNPFSVQETTWRVTSSDDAGPNTLRDAIDQANADTASSRRFITFGLTGSTLIQTSSSLPWITQTTTVDGTSQNGGTTPAVTVRGFGTGAGGNGIAVNAPNCVVRGLVLQNHSWAIRFFIAPSGLIERNYVGTDETGTAARPNDSGISVAGSPGTVVGGDIGGDPGAGNVVGGNVTGVQFSESGVAVYGNRIGVGANGTSSIPNGIAVMSHGTNHTIGSPDKPNTIANNVRILDATNNGGLVVRGNATYANEAGMMIGNIRQDPPDIVSAVVNEGTLTIQTTLTPYAGTQGVRLDLYEADTTNLVPQGRAWHATSPCFSGDALTAQTWIAGNGYATRDKIVLTATAYSDAGCTTVGAGTSPFIGSVFTTTGTNTLFGDFSDPASWSSGALPAAGQNFIVKSGRFDIGSPEAVYGDMILGSRIGGGGLSFEAGNEETLHVNNIRAQNPASFIIMAADTSLQVDGSFDPNLVFFPDTGTVTFGGAGQTIPALNYFELEILAPIAGVTAGTMSVSSDLEIGNGTYDFSGATVELRGEGAIGTVGNGTAVFSDLVVPAGADAEADVSQITVNHLLTVNGTFAAGVNTIVAGTGLLTGNGTVVVTGAAPTNSFAGQYTLNRDIDELTVFFEGEAAQSVDALSYHNLTIENAFGATVQGSGIVSVAGVLSLEEGPFASGAGSIQLGAGAIITSVAGWINGGLTATIATGSLTYTFPVGIAAGATPMVVAFHDVTQSGTLFVSATAEHPNLSGSGIDPARDANVYFRLQPAAGLTFTSYDLTLTYGTHRDAAATPLAFKLRRYDGGTWFQVPSAIPMAAGITAGGLTGGGDFVTGNQLVDHYTVTASSPRVAGATFLTTVTAKDLFDVTASGSITTVTMTSNTGHAQFDSNGDGTFGDNTKALASGTFSIVTKDNVAESVTLIATDANAKTGSGTVTIDPLLAPASLSATAANTALVQLSWSAVTGATSYQIWRKSGGGYTLLAATGNTTYPDAAVTAGTSYVYQVRAVAGDVQSAFSPADAATTIVFTDPALNNTVRVKAVHLTELRTAVNAMRAAAGLGAAVFTDPAITPQSTKIKAVHLAELRTALDQARAALGLPAISYTDPVLIVPTTPVKAVHWMEVRAGTQ